MVSNSCPVQHDFEEYLHTYTDPTERSHFRMNRIYALEFQDSNKSLHLI